MKKKHIFLFILILALPGLASAIGWVWAKTASAKQISDQLNRPWEQIPSLQKFTEIVDANAHAVSARATDNKIYVWDFYCDVYNQKNCDKWLETDQVPDSTEDLAAGSRYPMLKNTDCPNLQDSYQKRPPERVSECALGEYDIYYALLEDGTIWFWRRPAQNDTLPEFWGAYLGLSAGIVLSAVSITLIIIVLLFNAIRKILLKKIQQGIATHDT